MPEPLSARLEMLREGTIKRIHVAQQVIRRNTRHDEDEPPITIQTSRGPIRASDVTIHGTSRLVYQRADPLSCGARLWIETHARVTPESPSLP